MTTWILLLFPVAMLLAALHDLAKMEIPNWLTLGLAVGFFPLALSAGLPLSVLTAHALCATAALALVFVCFALDWMGGGDAKLIAAVALWLGPSAEFASFLLLSSVLGGILTLVLILARLCLKPTTGMASLDRLLDPESGIPYGVALGTAGLLVYPSLSAAFSG